MPEEFDREFWEERYRGRAAAGLHEPNPQLVAEAAGLAPGRALDAGCGEGADALWLASRGWRVTAVDIAATALRRARQHAEALGTDITSRIDWVQADLTGWTPAEEQFDLVSTHYVHPAGSREALFDRLAASVAPGGTLLVVGHHPSDPHTTGRHTTDSHGADLHGADLHDADPHNPAPNVHFTAEEVAAGLDPDRWEVVVAEARSRSVTGHDGREIAMRDTVLRARRNVPPTVMEN
ncbi:SAM-dependent methyltransferase [Saccharothrix tamanrassetensis]|uniref:SAM-dependent methyltransferase n=1 Tax=Saccharothrix tamanrassetensis TaxID=1051531 RepID=A0A841CA36_9PSEU|nr:class I SAM-dependent methyltransferase [Saccharothrix tamanrassetensis]MBB5953830.1 SAM-dependent methyltransferase [Saccharothrix tamanrassetensis]